MKRHIIVYVISGILFILISSATRAATFENSFQRSSIRLKPVDSWQETNLQGAPDGRYGHTMIWTGNEVIVWGGYYHLDHFLNDGHRYDPASNTWEQISNVDAPLGRARHTAIWTGQEMILWGGESGGGGVTTNTGARYDPISDTWTPISLDNAPSAREMHSAVWTGSEMIIWGGCTSVECANPLSDGGRYDAETDTWVPITSDDSLTARHFHLAFWSGERMLVWGGSSDPRGATYDPGTNTWTAISATDAPPPTFQGAGVWTGQEMILWGGCTQFSLEPCASYTNQGGRYHLVEDTWSPLPTEGAPTARYTHTAVWTGEEMIVWGGCDQGCFNTGGIYDPGLDFWTDIETSNAPIARSKHEAVWTGNKMIVWGGCDIPGCGDATYFNTGGSLSLMGPTTTATLTPTSTPTSMLTSTQISTFMPTTDNNFLPLVIKLTYASITPTPTSTLLPVELSTPTLTPVPTETPNPTDTPEPDENCHPSYPTVCIPPPPPDLDCSDIAYRNFSVLPPDPHRFDGDGDGFGCEG